MTAADLMTAGDVAKRLRVSKTWVYAHANGSRLPFLPSVAIGRAVRFDPADVDKFVEECKRLKDGYPTIH